MFHLVSGLLEMIELKLNFESAIDKFDNFYYYMINEREVDKDKRDQKKHRRETTQTERERKMVLLTLFLEVDVGRARE